MRGRLVKTGVAKDLGSKVTANNHDDVLMFLHQVGVSRAMYIEV